MIGGCSPGRLSPLYLTSPIRTVAQEVEQRSPLERDAAAGGSGCKQLFLRADVALLEIANEGIHSAELEICVGRSA